MQVEELKTKIVRAFADVPYPGDNHIAYHECDECDGVRKDFRGQSPASLAPQVVDYNYESFPLLSPQAQRYFLPAYLADVIDNFDSKVTFYLLFNLSSARRKSLRNFTPKEKEAVVDFLHYLRSIDEHEEYDEEIKQALEIWGNDTN